MPFTLWEKFLATA